jgi:hypothetical protein
MDKALSNSESEMNLKATKANCYCPARVQVILTLEKHVRSAGEAVENSTTIFVTAASFQNLYAQAASCDSDEMK